MQTVPTKHLSDSHAQNPHWFSSFSTKCTFFQTAVDVSDISVLKYRYTSLLNLSLISEADQQTVELSQSVFLETIILEDSLQKRKIKELSCDQMDLRKAEHTCLEELQCTLAY